jgi:hypothetical protein
LGVGYLGIPFKIYLTFIMAIERSIHGWNKSGVLDFLEGSGSMSALQLPKLEHVDTPSKLNFLKKRKKNCFLQNSEYNTGWTSKSR